MLARRVLNRSILGGRPSSASVFPACAGRWSDGYRQLLSRLAVLEPWDESQGADLLLDDDVHYHLRRTTLRYPIPGSGPVGNVDVGPGGLAGGGGVGLRFHPRVRPRQPLRVGGDPGGQSVGRRLRHPRLAGAAVTTRRRFQPSTRGLRSSSRSPPTRRRGSLDVPDPSVSRTSSSSSRARPTMPTPAPACGQPSRGSGHRAQRHLLVGPAGTPRRWMW